MVVADGPGVYDPCEREPTDLCMVISLQAREDLTASAQVSLDHTLYLTGERRPPVLVLFQYNTVLFSQLQTRRIRWRQTSFPMLPNRELDATYDTHCL